MTKRKEIKSELAWATPDRIFVKGFDLCQDLLGHISLGDMAFLELMDRKPTTQESNVFNAMAITLVEHGLSPSAIATRLTFAGAPEAMQAAVAAGLSGLGSVFVGSMENAARVMQDALPLQQPSGNLAQCARDIVARHVAAKTAVPAPLMPTCSPDASR